MNGWIVFLHPKEIGNHSILQNYQALGGSGVPDGCGWPKWHIYKNPFSHHNFCVWKMAPNKRCKSNKRPLSSWLHDFWEEEYNICIPWGGIPRLSWWETTLKLCDGSSWKGIPKMNQNDLELSFHFRLMEFFFRWKLDRMFQTSILKWRTR